MDERMITRANRQIAAHIRGRREDVLKAQYLETSAVCVAHEKGLSWSQIGSIYGISRQAAWQRWGGNFDDPEST
jgi:hypothetical protein